MTTNNNLNLLAYAAPQSKMARARAHGKIKVKKVDYNSENFH